MKLHEYQAKAMLKKYGVPVPEGIVASRADEAVKAAEELAGSSWVVKAQVHAGGRGKGGGIKFVDKLHEIKAAVETILDKPLVTKQTGPNGKRVQKVLIEKSVKISRELYLAIVIDRSESKPVMILSQAGGMDIEDVAKESPDLVLKHAVNSSTGWTPSYGRFLAYQLDPLPEPETLKELLDVMGNLYNLFVSLDCSIAEINPLAITDKGSILAVDAKIDIDDNALYRQKEMLDFRDYSEADPLEKAAELSNLNYIRLDGNIGVMVNGAGLAMATMDMIKLAGADPANFLDVGGGASEEMIAKGFEIILRDEKVKAVLINIFGGILRCDVLARGVLSAAEMKEIKIPVIVRLEGTNVEEGRKILEGSDLKFMVAKDLVEAADLVAGIVST